MTGDIRELVIAPCRTVGRPIFFSVLIMLLSFIPVFMLSGREGKYFHPLAFTKSFALIGTAIISVTVVPALIPLFIRGRLRREEENWIVRSFINIYKPVLQWALPRWNLVMWLFAALLILAAGLFPVQAIFGYGSSETAWRIFFLIILALVTAVTVIFSRGFAAQAAAGASLVLLALWAFHFPKIGVIFMPALDEGTTLDMPSTVPRASVTQSADDLKHRDGLLRGFPEVESVIGKAGRANTPTDPAPLEMFETIINFRPKVLWPKRVLKFNDAVRQSRAVLHALEEQGFVLRTSHEDDRDNLINDATQKALERFDETMRELALLRFRELEKELGPLLTRFVVVETMRRFHEAGDLPDLSREKHQEFVERFTKELTGDFGPWLAKIPALEDITRMTQHIARELAKENAFPSWFELTEASLRALQADGVPIDRLNKLKGNRYASEDEYLEAVEAVLGEKNLTMYRNKLLQHGRTKLEAGDALAVKESGLPWFFSVTGEFLGAAPKTFAGEVLKATEAQRLELWRQRLPDINWELFDRGVEAYTWYALEEIVKSANSSALVSGASRGQESERFSQEAVKSQLGQGTANPFRAKSDKDAGRSAFEPFQALRQELEKPFQSRVFFWQRQSGPRGDLVDDEMGRVLQVPGWGNNFIQPIINRIEMLSTGIRTTVGVKVFGPDLPTIDQVCKDIEAVLKPITGARYVLAALDTKGKGYLQIDIDREKAARYGISVEDIQNEIEVALGGRVITYTIEKRERFPVRVRYARDNREDEEAVKRLLVSPGSMARPMALTVPSSSMNGPMSGRATLSIKRRRVMPPRGRR